jgi:C-terminal processing protease CtpA/Prc
VDPAPVASTHVDRHSASTPSDAFTEVDRQLGDQPSDAFTQVDQQQANQQWEDSARIDQQPPSQLADASGQEKKKAEKPIQQSDASAAKGADPATPRAPHDESKPTNANAPAVPHLGIGVANLTPGIAEAIGLAKKRGVIIMAVDPGSPAEKAGVRTRDLLLKIGGTPVSRPDQVREALHSFKGKHTLVLTLKRDGKIEHLKLNVG